MMGGRSLRSCTLEAKTPGPHCGLTHDPSAAASDDTKAQIRIRGGGMQWRLESERRHLLHRNTRGYADKPSLSDLGQYDRRGARSERRRRARERSAQAVSWPRSNRLNRHACRTHLCARTCRNCAPARAPTTPGVAGHAWQITSRQALTMGQPTMYERRVVPSRHKEESAHSAKHRRANGV